MIRYRHRNCDKAFLPATFSYDLPMAYLFVKMIEGAENIINFPFGVTLVHPKDRYEKSVGRECALRAMRITQFYLHKIKIEDKKLCFELNTIKDCKLIELFITVDPHKSKVRLDYIEVTKL